MRLWLVILLTFSTGAAHSARIKDIANVLGARPNQLVGYGMVVGLAGTGDDQNATFSGQSITTMLRRLGLQVDGERLRLRNVAAVVVTADLPAFVAPGQRIDVTVSSIGNAKSLHGGTLLAAPLKGADGKIYAVAQGPLSLGGFSATGRTGSSVQQNHPTVGRIPGGAIVEREVQVELASGELVITLRDPDFTTASRMATEIRTALAAEVAAKATAAAQPTDALSPEGQQAAPETATEATPPAPEAAPALAPEVRTRDAGSVVVSLPPAWRDDVPGLIAKLEALQVEPDLPSRIVVNERTGTVVLGDNVRVSPVAIAHGGLTVEVDESFAASQPGPFSRGNTAVLPRSRVQAQTASGKLELVSAQASLGDVVKALNALGVTPRDLIAILQALESAGALGAAELVLQ